MYAHIYKAAARTGYKIHLMLTAAPDISVRVPGLQNTEKYFNSRVEAKRFAKNVGATPHNY